MIYLLALLGIVLFYAGYERGKSVARKERVVPVTRCHAYEGIITDWMKKNQLIHRLETRIFRLKRANRNLRANVRYKNEWVKVNESHKDGTRYWGYFAGQDVSEDTCCVVWYETDPAKTVHKKPAWTFGNASWVELYEVEPTRIMALPPTPVEGFEGQKTEV